MGRAIHSCWIIHIPNNPFINDKLKVKISLFSWLSAKRKSTVMASTVMGILYLSSRPSVNQSFSDIRVLVVIMRVLVVIMRHDYSGSVQCSSEELGGSLIASRPLLRTQIMTPFNLHLTCSIFTDISISSSGIQYHSTCILHNGFWRTIREHKEQGKCSFRALVQSFQIHLFLHEYISQLVINEFLQAQVLITSSS